MNMHTSLPIKNLARALNGRLVSHRDLARQFSQVHRAVQAWRMDLEKTPSVTCAHLRDALLEIECAYCTAAEIFETLPEPKSKKEAR